MTTITPLDETPTLTTDVICELTSLNTNNEDVFANIVTLVGNCLEVDVCSIYLLESDRSSLVLAATVGLNQQCVGRLRMGLHEGLAGLVAEQFRPVAVAEAAKHSRFKYFPEAEEDAYESFLGVPLTGNGLLQGVLVVQTTEPRQYTEEEIEYLETVAEHVGQAVWLAFTT